ncbi:MAG TPA: cardiolipin synthase [Salinimicrobium sp.]|nr:cardiolipin synthase [Salinimicrobium sp.]
MWLFLKDNFWLLLLIINYVIAMFTAGFIVMNNRNPVKTLSFVLALIVLPFISILIYYFFGQEYRKTKIFKRKHIFDHEKIKKWEKKLLLSETELDKIERNFLDEKIKLVKLLQNNQNSPLTFRNEVEILLNGEKKFEMLRKDILNAKDHIHLEYYILNDDTIGSELIEMLCKKCQEGVSVRVSYDYVGSILTSKTVKKMKSMGIEVFPFMPVWFPNLTRKLNYRDHRKIVIIDGLIGYVGGINISEYYVNPNKFEVFWRDTHLKITGHAVKTLQTQFLLNWDFVSAKKNEIQDNFFPKVDIKSTTAVQIAASGPDTDWANIMEAIFTAITTAEDFVYLTTPYFIPNDEILTALVLAARSGVEVKLIIPKNGDSWAAKYATNSYIEELLESGVQVYHYCKGMIHAKTMVVDNIFSTVGTSNMDNRSFNINFEINALIFNKEISRQMVEIFEADIKDCDAIDLDEWKERSFFEKVKESFCRLWAPLL